MFYFQTDFNLRFKRKRDVRLTCTRIWCILHRTLSLTWPRRLTSHIIAQIDLTSCFKNTSFEWNKAHQTLTDHRSKCAKRGKREMCNFGSCKTRFEFLSQFRKVRNAFQCFVTHVQTLFAKIQMRLAYEDKRDLYCTCRQFKHCSKSLISGHYLPQLIWKVDQKLNQVKSESVLTFLKITHLASRKSSYLVVFCSNSYE